MKNWITAVILSLVTSSEARRRLSMDSGLFTDSPIPVASAEKKEEISATAAAGVMLKTDSMIDVKDKTSGFGLSLVTKESLDGYERLAQQEREDISTKLMQEEAARARADAVMIHDLTELEAAVNYQAAEGYKKLSDSVQNLVTDKDTVDAAQVQKLSEEEKQRVAMLQKLWFSLDQVVKENMNDYVETRKAMNVMALHVQTMMQPQGSYENGHCCCKEDSCKWTPQRCASQEERHWNVGSVKEPEFVFTVNNRAQQCLDQLEADKHPGFGGMELWASRSDIGEELPARGAAELMTKSADAILKNRKHFDLSEKFLAGHVVEPKVLHVRQEKTRSANVEALRKVDEEAMEALKLPETLAVRSLKNAVKIGLDAQASNPPVVVNSQDLPVMENAAGMNMQEHPVTVDESHHKTSSSVGGSSSYNTTSTYSSNGATTDGAHHNVKSVELPEVHNNINHSPHSIASNDAMYDDIFDDGVSVLSDPTSVMDDIIPYKISDSFESD